MINGNLNRFKSITIYQNSQVTSSKATMQTAVAENNSTTNSYEPTTRKMQSKSAMVSTRVHRDMSATNSSISSFDHMSALSDQQSPPLPSSFITRPSSSQKTKPTTSLTAAVEATNSNAKLDSYQFISSNMMMSSTMTPNNSSNTNNNGRQKLLHLSEGIKHAHLSERFGQSQSHHQQRYQTRACAIQ